MRQNAMLKRIIAVLAVCLALALPLQCGCAFSRADGFFASLAESFAGVKEPEYGKLSVSLPAHAGYAALEGKDAFAALASDKQREAYAAIESSLYFISKQSAEQRWPTAIARIPKLSSGEIFMVKEAVLADHPEAFWVTGDYSLGYNLHDGNYLQLYSGYSYEMLISMLKALEKSVSSALKEIPSNLSEYERELIIHDILVRDTEYDASAAITATAYTGAASSYGAMVNRSALCSGYAKAAKLLLNRTGVHCATVKGVAGGVGHMWNLVRIDQSWYHLDVTWDDPITLRANPAQSYDYFNLSDELIMADHEISAGYDKLTEELISSSGGSGLNFYNFDMPKCTELAANYYYLNASEINDLGSGGVERLEELAGECLRGGGNMIYVAFPEYMEPELIDEWLNDAISAAATNANRKSAGGRRVTGFARSDRLSDEDTPWSHVFYIRLIFNS